MLAGPNLTLCGTGASALNYRLGYFDNDMTMRAPFDVVGLRERVAARLEPV
jgi:hypothetical protein